MFVDVKVVDKDNIIRFIHQFDRKKKVDLEKIKAGLREKYPEPEYKLEVS